MGAGRGEGQKRMALRAEFAYRTRLTKGRYKEKLMEMRPLLWIELVAWIIFGWGISSWRTTVIGYIVSVSALFALPLWGEYRRMKRERRDTLLRRGVPDDQV